MVSQVNYFRNDITGELFDTPAEAMESERRVGDRQKYLQYIRGE